MKERWKNCPIVTYGIIAINVIIFLWLEWMGDTENVILMVRNGALMKNLVIDEGQWWRMLTSCFLHFGFSHILGNMIILALAGDFLEKEIGHVRYTILYLLSGIGGNLCSLYSMTLKDEIIVSAGASGAIFGIVAGLLLIVIRNKGNYHGISVSRIILMIVLSLYNGFVSENTDNAAHIGGLIVGFVMCFLFSLKRSKVVDFGDET